MISEFYCVARSQTLSLSVHSDCAQGLSRHRVVPFSVLCPNIVQGDHIDCTIHFCCLSYLQCVSQEKEEEEEDNWEEEGGEEGEYVSAPFSLQDVMGIHNLQAQARTFQDLARREELVYDHSKQQSQEVLRLKRQLQELEVGLQTQKCFYTVCL